MRHAETARDAFPQEKQRRSEEHWYGDIGEGAHETARRRQRHGRVDRPPSTDPDQRQRDCVAPGGLAGKA